MEKRQTTAEVYKANDKLLIDISDSIQLNTTVLTGYSDSDHDGNLGDRKSTSRFMFIPSGCVIFWKSTKQKTVSISSTEDEYIALLQHKKLLDFKNSLMNWESPNIKSSCVVIT